MTMTTRRSKAQSRSKPHTDSRANESDVEFQSILRIRPLHKKEKDDHVILEAKHHHSNKRKTATALLHPMQQQHNSFTSPDASSMMRRGSFSPNFVCTAEEQVFHFDKIFDPSATQDTVHYAVGLSMASHAMDPLKKGPSQPHASSQVTNHLVLSMGIAGGGKSHTLFGPTKALGRAGKQTDDGLVPRILESLFAQSKHHVSSKSSFAIRMTLLHVEGDKVHDVLSETDVPTSDGKKRAAAGVKAMVANFERSRGDDDHVLIDQDPDTHDYHAHASVKTCWNATEARETLHVGLTRAQSSSRFAGFGGKMPVMGHTLVTMQPILIRGRRRDSSAIDRCGGSIAVLDLAGIERAKKSRSGSAAKHESVAANSSHSAVMHVLRTLKHNSDVRAGKESFAVFRDDEDSSDGSDISNVSEPKASNQGVSLKTVPYRQSKVTMLLQPFFSQTGEWNSVATLGKTVVTTVLAAYPGHRDYVEKQSLLHDMELLFGMDVPSTASHRVHTGVTGDASVTKRPGRRSAERKTVEEDRSARRDDRRKAASPYTKPSAPSESFDLYSTPIVDTDSGAPIAPIPPPLVHSQMHSASAPPVDDLDVTSPSLHPKESASRSIFQDFPGVSLPGKSTPVRTAAMLPKATALGEHPVRSAKKDRSPHPRHRPIPSNDPGASPSTPLRAKVGSSPNIRPPNSTRKTPVKEEGHSPSKHWKTGSPLKSISRAVHAASKTGKRALDKTVNTFTDSGEVSKENLFRRVKELEDENDALHARNNNLEGKCKQLQREKDQLQRSLREATQRWKQSWSKDDEEDWQRSKRLRVQEQRLIGSPLEHHIAHVEATHELSSDWVHTGKPPFALQFPQHWTPASVLNDREHGDESVPTTK